MFKWRRMIKWVEEHNWKRIDNLWLRAPNSHKEITRVNIGKWSELGNINSNKILLLMDDHPETMLLYHIAISRLYREVGVDVHKEFRIIECSGKCAGQLAIKYVEGSNSDVVVALLDLTLGKIEMVGSKVMVSDGVDVAVQILDRHPNCLIRFVTGSRLDMELSFMRKVSYKLYKNTNMDLLENSFSKTANFYENFRDVIMEAVND